MIEGTSETEPLGTDQALSPPWGPCRQNSGVASGQARELYVSDCGMD